jgi:threonine/homoserine/homoserine lactone efflux protein
MQVDFGVLGTFTLLWLAIVPTPGPNSLLIVHLALTAGWRDVRAALAGNLLGIALYAIGTLLGLALLLTGAPSIRLLLSLAGGCYVMWIGIRLVRGGLCARADRAAAASLQYGSSVKRMPFSQGLFTALANVQALFLLASIFASVGILTASAATGFAAVLIIIVGNCCYLSLLAWLMQREAPRAFYARYRHLLHVIFGLVFLALAFRIVQREILT